MMKKFRLYTFLHLYARSLNLHIIILQNSIYFQKYFLDYSIFKVFFPCSSIVRNNFGASDIMSDYFSRPPP